VQLRLHQQLAGLIADYPDIGQNLQAMQGFGMGQMQRQQQQQQLQQPVRACIIRLDVSPACLTCLLPD
jgi:hypothetical protein